MSIDFSRDNPNLIIIPLEDWNPTTYEEAVAEGQKPNFNGGFIYSASKKIAEKAAFDFVDKNKPNFKIVTRESLTCTLIGTVFTRRYSQSANDLRTHFARVCNLGRLTEYVFGDHLQFILRCA